MLAMYPANSLELYKLDNGWELKQSRIPENYGTDASLG